MTEDRPVSTGLDDGWRGVDEGWGRRAVEFATLSEPTNCREYLALHHRLGVDAGDKLLDVACGAGLAVELAGLRGAQCAGIDASPRLLAVARDRNPDADLRVGDMHALPWDDDAFDIVTSFRGIWGTTPRAIAEVHRVLVPGGRVGLTVWGHIKASPGAWALAPFSLAAAPKVQNQAAMVALGRPGAGEALLQDAGFTNVERVDIPFVFEFADPEMYRERWRRPARHSRLSRQLARQRFCNRRWRRLVRGSARASPSGRPLRLWATSPASLPIGPPSAIVPRPSGTGSQEQVSLLRRGTRQKPNACSTTT